MRLRLARNIPMERWKQSAASLFDLEEIDEWSLPVRVVAIGATAQEAHAIIIKLEGDLVE